MLIKYKKEEQLPDFFYQATNERSDINMTDQTPLFFNIFLWISPSGDPFQSQHQRSTGNH